MPLDRRFLFVAALTFVGGVASAAERPWLEVKSAHFTVLTNAGEGTARDLAWQFEQMRAALQKLWPWAQLSAGKPVLVLGAKDETTMKALAPKYWEKGGMDIVSVSVEGRDRHYLALQIDTNLKDDVRVNPYFNVYRAYVHIVLNSSFDRPLPLWLRRGMAELFGNLRVRDKDVFVGRMVPWHAERLKQRTSLPLATLFETGRESDLTRDESRRELFDSQAWGLLHYLIFADEGVHAAKLNRYCSLLLQGTKPDVALRESFSDLSALEKGFNTYIHHRAVEYMRIDVDVSIDREKLPTRAVPAAESAAQRAAFHVAMERPAEALALMHQAKAADPAHAGAFDVEGLLADSADEDDKARAAYARAAELGSASFFTWYRNAQLLHGAMDRATHERMEKSLQKCVELNPDYAAGHSYLAEVEIQLGKLQEALVLARRAIALEPGGSYHHVALANALSTVSKREEAIAEAQRGLDLADSDQQRQNASRMLDFVKRASATEAVASQRGGPSSDSVAACGRGDGAACARIMPELVKFCDSGQAQACGALAWLYQTGSGVAADAAKTAAYTAKACTAGDKSSCARAAWLEAKGEGLAKNEAKAMAALEGLCSEGFLEGCKVLGILHAAKSTKASFAKARELIKRSCDGGDQAACSMLTSLPK